MNGHTIRTRMRWVALGVLLLCGTASAIGNKLQPGEESTFAVPRMPAPPTINGVVDPVEWREAVAVSGTTDVGTDLLNSQPVIFYLAWDEKHLYMACRVYLRGAYKPRNHGGRVPGGADCYDDGLECLFKPMGRNVSDQNHRTEFKFNISSLGHGGTYTRLVVGQIMKNWDPAFRTAARLTEPGTAPDGGKWWELETAFSLQDFELVGDNRAGDQWKLMLGINHMPAAGWYQGRVPCIGSYFTPDGKSVATLVENLPVVQMLVESPSNVASDGTANLRVKACNATKNPARVTIDLDVAGRIVTHETLELAAGGEQTFTVSEKLPAEVTTGRLSLRAVSGEATLLRYTGPFEVGTYNNRLEPVPDPDPNEFPFRAAFNPLRGLLRISGDSYFLPEPDAVKGLHYEIRHKETGKAIASGDITEARAWRFEDVLALRDIGPGEYQAAASLVLKNGRSFGPRTTSFEKKDEAKVFAHWWGRDPGNSERVVAPFEAIERRPTGPAFSCWGREYAFNALGLPVAVRSQGGDVLAAPARIVVTVAGRETAVPVGTLKITDQKEWRVRFQGGTEGAGLAFAAEGWMEQDGMVSVDLTYAPADGKPVTVEALRIEYPVADGVAECLVSVGPGGNFAAMTATVLPPGKQGTLWTTFDTGRPGAQMKVGSFYPHVWLGSEQRGFQWWADSDRGWFPDDDVPAHEVRRERVSGFSVQVSEGDGKQSESPPETRNLKPGTSSVVLRNNIIGKPIELTGPRTLSFTWMASPFKPLPKGWRMIAATDNGTFVQPHRGMRINPETDDVYAKSTCNWINPADPNPENWARLWHEQKTRGIPRMQRVKREDGSDAWQEAYWLPSADEVVRQRRPFDLYGARTGVSLQHMSFQLIGWGRKSMEDWVFDYFGDEWQDGGRDTWNPSYTDYGMYLLDRAFGEGGVVSTYWDISFPTLYSSPLAGLSYQLPDGRWQPGYNTLNCRRFFQRLWAVQDKHGLNPGAVGCHSTQSYIFPALPWIDAVLDGERDWNIDVSDMDWVDYYPKERMRAMSVPHTWGVGICWMSNFSSAHKEKRINAKTVHAEYVWLHDSWINPYLDYPHVTRMPQSILDWGLNGETVSYVPYWRNPYAATGDADLLVSLWRIPDEAGGRILVGVFNYHRRATKDVTVTLDLAELGLAGQPLDLRDLSRDFLLGYAGRKDVVDALALSNPRLGTAAVLDAAAGVLRFEGLGAHRGRYIGIGAAGAREEAALAQQLPAWAGGNGLTAVKDQGFVRKETKHFAPGQAPGVSCEDGAIQLAMWQLPDRILLAVHNSAEKAGKDAEIKVDLDALGLAPQLPWQDFLGVRSLYAEEKAPPPVLDFYGRTLTIKAIPAGSGRLVAIRRY